MEVFSKSNLGVVLALTILGIASIVGLSDAKDIVLAIVSGLVGYMSKSE